MPSRKWMLFIFLIAMFNISLSFSQTKNCNLSGGWFDDDPGGGTGKWNLSQDGSNLTGYWRGMPDQTCGRLLVSGTAGPSGFSFKAAYENQDQDSCKWWIKMDGTFTSSNCTSIQGNWIDSTNYSSEFRWLNNNINFDIIKPNPGTVFTITKEPRMPELKAYARLKRRDEFDLIQSEKPFQFNWNVNIQYNLTPSRIITDDLPKTTTDNGSYEPKFNLLNGVRGGTLDLSVEYDNTLIANSTYPIDGTNPGKNLIEQLLIDDTSQHIACQESSYRQFDAELEAGQGLPLVGRTDQGEVGGVGIMQIYHPQPSDEAVWNWKQNIVEGLSILNNKRQEARNLYITERTRLNKERQKKGLPICPEGIPSQLNSEQIERESIRRYNCGREYRWEPRDAENCSGQWVIKPTLCPGADPDYVEKVLNCSIGNKT